MSIKIKELEHADQNEILLICMPWVLDIEGTHRDQCIDCDRELSVRNASPKNAKPICINCLEAREPGVIQRLLTGKEDLYMTPEQVSDLSEFFKRRAH